MDTLKGNLSHLIMAVVIVAAATVLASTHVISGAEGVTLIAAAGGFSLGAGASSASASLVAPTVTVTSHSNGEQTATVTPSPSAPGTPATTVAP